MIEYELTKYKDNLPLTLMTTNKIFLENKLERCMIADLGRELIETMGIDKVHLNMPDINETGAEAHRYHIIMFKNEKCLHLFINFSISNTDIFGTSITFMKPNDKRHYNMKDESYFDLNRMDHFLIGETTFEMRNFIKEYFKNEKKEAN